MRTIRQSISTTIPVLMVSLLLAPTCRAEISWKDGLQLTGDFRSRLEADFDSRQSNGTERDDRTRLRIRARVGLDYAPDDRFSFGFRLRSGSDDSHQSPHITVLDFDDHDTGDADFNLDKWYAKIQGERAWAWIGRSGLPLWKQNELFWDDDVTPAGLAFGFKTDLGAGSFAVNAGYFTPPVGMQEFAGDLGVGQLVFQTGGFTVAGAVLSFDADSGDPDAAKLLRGNGFRDYTILVGSLQYQFQAGGLPLTLGGDVLHNSESYSATDPDLFTAANHDQTEGFVLMAQVGATKAKGDWLAAWYYAEIETFAVNASYSQDDWMRWGSAAETRSSDFEGHELRFAYALEKNQNLVFRLYLVDAITTDEDGGRFRVDYNFKF